MEAEMEQEGKDKEEVKKTIGKQRGESSKREDGSKAFGYGGWLSGRTVARTGGRT